MDPYFDILLHPYLLVLTCVSNLLSVAINEFQNATSFGVHGGNEQAHEIKAKETY